MIYFRFQKVWDGNLRVFIRIWLSPELCSQIVRECHAALRLCPVSKNRVSLPCSWTTLCQAYFTVDNYLHIIAQLLYILRWRQVLFAPTVSPTMIMLVVQRYQKPEQEAFHFSKEKKELKNISEFYKRLIFLLRDSKSLKWVYFG